ncbi:MAG: translation initiation factor eIF-2B [Thermomicrobiales bacterium]
MADEAVIAAARALRADRVHGAMELALRAVESAVDLLAAKPERDVRQVARALMAARPSMAAIGNAVALTLAPIVEGSVARSALRESATARQRQWIADATRLTERAIPHIPKDLLTYSHSSSTRNALLAAKKHLRTVIIPEGRPVADGKGLARILAAAGIPVTVITEAQIGRWVREVDAVLVGADTIGPDGSVYNHMGTATLALLAREYGKPICSLTHSLKVAPYDRPMDMDEENDPAEVWADPPPGITVRNPAFDRTLADRITVLTERGILTDALRATLVVAHRAARETVTSSK